MEYINIIVGKALSKEFTGYLKKFKEVRMRSSAAIYFKLVKSDLEDALSSYTQRQLVIKYKYREGFNDILWIESIK